MGSSPCKRCRIGEETSGATRGSSRARSRAPRIERIALAGASAALRAVSRRSVRPRTTQPRRHRRTSSHHGRKPDKAPTGTEALHTEVRGEAEVVRQGGGRQGGEQEDRCQALFELEPHIAGEAEAAGEASVAVQAKAAVRAALR